MLVNMLISYIKFIKKELNFGFIAFASGLGIFFMSLLALVGYLIYLLLPSYKDKFATYTLSGYVLEYGSEASVPEFELNLDDLHMYTDHLGYYKWPDLKKEKQLNFTLPNNYEENRSEPINYYSDFEEEALTERSLSHNFYITLNAPSTADRLFGFLANGNYTNLWTYLTEESKSMWGNKESDFSKALKLERSLRIRKDNSHIIDYEILDEERVSESIYNFRVLWTRGDSTTFETVETIAKEGGWWQYVWTEDPKDVYRYIYITEQQFKK